MISFDEGIPIAISNTKGTKKILYLKDSINSENKYLKTNIESLLTKKQIDKIKNRIGESNYKILSESIKKAICPNSEVLRELYESIMEDNDGKKYLDLKQTYSPVPCMLDNQRDCIYICGPSGVGKSVYLNNYVKNYHLMNPTNDIYLYSALKEDESLKNKKIKRVDLDNLAGQLSLDTSANLSDNIYLHNSLVLFDDIDSLENPLLTNFIDNLKNSILETGRHYNTFIAVTSHQICNFSKTKLILNECTHITLFPSSNKQAILNHLIKKMGLSTILARNICNLNTRWITISNKFPQYILHERGVIVL